MYSQTLRSILNLSKPELEIKLVENVGGGWGLVKHEAKLEENKGGEGGGLELFSRTEKNKNLRY